MARANLRAFSSPDSLPMPCVPEPGPMDTQALFALARVDFATYERLIGLIHDGAFDLQAWDVCLHLLQAQLQANYVSLVLLPDLAGPGLPILFAGQARPDLLAAYTDVLHGLDPFVNLPRDRMLAVDELISEVEWLDSVVYRTCMAPLGIRHLAGADLDVGSEAVCRFRVCRSADSGPFGEAERALCALLLPHFKQALRARAALDGYDRERRLYAGTLERLAVGTLWVDRHGQVLGSNRVADEILAADDGLRLVGQALRPSLRTERVQLQAMIARVGGEHGKGPGLVEGMTLTRPSGRSRLGVLVRPVPPASIAEYGPCPAAVLHLSDTERSVGASPALLRSLFGLTAAESGLALLLVEGLTLDEASARQGVSRHTARSQLRSIFAKTGVTRQTELLRLVLRSVVPLG